jgi:hypothetical protein
MFTVAMARTNRVTISEIMLGEMVGVDPISCPPLGSTGTTSPEFILCAAVVVDLGR